MVESHEEKKRHSERQFERAASSKRPDETAPAEINAAVVEFAESLGSSKPISVTVIQDPCGLYGWSADGVLEKIRHDGGSIEFGWVLWEWPTVLLTAEFHAVWKDPTGALLDITPKPGGESHIVFVPDKAYPPGFDFANRPRNQRWSLYGAGDEARRVAIQMERMSASQLAYETKRAAKAGKSLRELILARLPKDSLPDLIDRFTIASEHRERAFDAMPRGAPPSAEFSRHAAEADRLMKAIAVAVAG